MDLRPSPSWLDRVAVLLFACGLMIPALAAREVAIGELPVAPLTRYRLTFRAETPPASTARWEVRITTAEGLLPYEGLLNGAWQQLTVGQRSYSHSFLTSRDGAKLALVVIGDDALPTVDEMALEQLVDTRMVINGDFAAGAGNFSGWTTRNLAVLVANEQGELELRCAPTGYALTDPIPVEPGATYRFTAGSQPGRVLIYDYDLLRIDWIEEPATTREPLFTMPTDAAFVRIEYCDGRPHRTPVIRSVDMELVEAGAKVEDTVFPAYPGEIVVGGSAALPEVRAARELQHWIRKISGKRIRVLARPSGLATARFFIGRHFAEEHFADDLARLAGSDGFAIRSRGGDIHVFGARPAGALFGAIRLLEMNSDIIWARPRKAFGTVYSANPELAFASTDAFERPAFAYRMPGTPYAQRSDDGIWQGRMGMNTAPYYYNGFRREEMGGAHVYEGNYMATIAANPEFAYEKCRLEHPEFFAMINGKREIRPQGYICYTAPGIAKALADGLRTIMAQAEAEGRSLEHLAIRTRDGWAVCSCESCMAPIPLPDGTLLKPKSETSMGDPLFFSTRMTLMLNEVAAEFAKSYPELPITVPGYIYAAEPPAIPHAPSLIPIFCAYDTCSLRFPILEGQHNHAGSGTIWADRFREYLRRNGQEGRRLSMFTYYYPASFSTVATNAGADFSALVESGGVHGVHLDGFTPDMENDRRAAMYQHMWDYQAIERWIIARLLWDPTLDPQALRRDYITRAYGKAAPEMLAFHEIIHHDWTDPAIIFGPSCHATSASLFETLIVKTNREAKLRALLVAAIAKADNSNSRVLLERTLTAFDRLADTLNRIYVPRLDQATEEWQLADSTLWMQALKLGDFKRVTTWDDHGQAPALQPTQVAVMRDTEHLYFRIEARQAARQDQVELVLQAKRFAPMLYASMTRAGKRLTMRNFRPTAFPALDATVEDGDDSYTALFKVPLAMIETLDTSGKEIQLYAKFCRLVSTGNDCEESSLTGQSITMTHYMNYWTALSIVPEDD